MMEPVVAADGLELEAKKHRMEWCAATSKSRCVRCGRNINTMRMPWKCEGPRWTGRDGSHKLHTWRNAHLGEHNMIR